MNPRSLGNPHILLVTAAYVVLIAACGGGEPEDLIFDLEINERQLNINVMEAKQNDTLTLNISSDEPGAIHIHGYDYEEAISPEGITVLVFETNATGKFNITFHPGGGHGMGEAGTVHAHEDEERCEVAPILSATPPGISVSAFLSDEPHHIDIVATTENIVLSDDGNHWHLYVNGKMHSMNVEPEVTFDTRSIGSPGEYQIMATVSDAQHCDYDIQAMTTVVLEGEEPVDMEERGQEEEEVLLGSLEVQPR
ncbi:MAG: hypothetical protein QF579_01490 [Dehalococcoidia bacterium]|nr:hypothetical protein [Dehalococcoidia bacterium]